jgi:hypothetical protein
MPIAFFAVQGPHADSLLSKMPMLLYKPIEYGGHAAPQTAARPFFFSIGSTIGSRPLNWRYASDGSTLLPLL